MPNFKKIDPSIKVIATPILTIIVSLFAVFVIIQSGLPGIFAKLEDVKNSKKTMNTLEERRSVLTEFDRGTLVKQSDITFSVLPDRNSGAIALSQVRDLASANSLTLSEVEIVSAPDSENNIKKAGITYTLFSKDFLSALNFVLGMARIAPLSTVEEVEVDTDRELITVEIKSWTYWSSLPDNLPSLADPINELSAEERNTLKAVQSFDLPRFVILYPQESQERPNPFE